MIDGVVIKYLKVIPDERGFLMEMLRDDDSLFEGFGQVYMTGCAKGAAKGWHYHKKQTDHFVCVSGKALVVLSDLRDNSKTKGETNEFILEAPGEKYKGGEVKNFLNKGSFLLKIPKGVVHGFCAIDCDEARIMNIPNFHYKYKNPDEFRYPWNSSDIPYKWPEFIKFGG